MTVKVTSCVGHTILQSRNSSPPSTLTTVGTYPLALTVRSRVPVTSKSTRLVQPYECAPTNASVVVACPVDASTRVRWILSAGNGVCRQLFGFAQPTPKAANTTKRA